MACRRFGAASAPYEAIFAAPSWCVRWRLTPADAAAPLGATGSPRLFWCRRAGQWPRLLFPPASPTAAAAAARVTGS